MKYNKISASEFLMSASKSVSVLGSKMKWSCVYTEEFMDSYTYSNEFQSETHRKAFEDAVHTYIVILAVIREEGHEVGTEAWKKECEAAAKTLEALYDDPRRAIQFDYNFNHPFVDELDRDLNPWVWNESLPIPNYISPDVLEYAIHQYAGEGSITLDQFLAMLYENVTFASDKHREAMEYLAGIWVKELADDMADYDNTDDWLENVASLAHTLTALLKNAGAAIFEAYDVDCDERFACYAAA